MGSWVSDDSDRLVGDSATATDWCESDQCDVNMWCTLMAVAKTETRANAIAIECNGWNWWRKFGEPMLRLVSGYVVFYKVPGDRVQTSVRRSMRPEILLPVASTFCSVNCAIPSVLPSLTRIGATAAAVRRFWWVASMLDIRYHCLNIASVASYRRKPTSRSNGLDGNFVLRHNRCPPQHDSEKRDIDNTPWRRWCSRK